MSINVEYMSHRFFVALRPHARDHKSMHPINNSTIAMTTSIPNFILLFVFFVDFLSLLPLAGVTGGGDEDGDAIF